MRVCALGGARGAVGVGARGGAADGARHAPVDAARGLPRGQAAAHGLHVRRGRRGIERGGVPQLPQPLPVPAGQAGGGRPLQGGLFCG